MNGILFRNYLLDEILHTDSSSSKLNSVCKNLLLVTVCIAGVSAEKSLHARDNVHSWCTDTLGLCTKLMYWHAWFVQLWSPSYIHLWTSSNMCVWSPQYMFWGVEICLYSFERSRQTVDNLHLYVKTATYTVRWSAEVFNFLCRA